VLSTVARSASHLCTSPTESTGSVTSTCWSTTPGSSTRAASPTPRSSAIAADRGQPDRRVPRHADPRAAQGAARPRVDHQHRVGLVVRAPWTSPPRTRRPSRPSSRCRSAAGHQVCSARRGVRVNMIRPGGVATEMARRRVPSRPSTRRRRSGGSDSHARSPPSPHDLDAYARRPGQTAVVVLESPPGSSRA